jgi:hypothetical protein
MDPGSKCRKSADYVASCVDNLPGLAKQALTELPAVLLSKALGLEPTPGLEPRTCCLRTRSA